MSEIFDLRYEGCGHTCHHDPNKYPEGSLIFDSAPTEGQERNRKNAEGKGKGRGKEVYDATEPVDQSRWFFNRKTKAGRSASLHTLAVNEEPRLITATQPLCPDCFNTEEDPICDVYAKRVKDAIKDCDTSGLTESETLQVCKLMEANHENELIDFHASSGYNEIKEKTASPLIKAESLLGFLAIAKTKWTQRNEPRCATPRTFKKADIDSDNRSLVQALWGASRSASPGPSGKTGEDKDSVAVARPRRDGTRFAFPVRIPKSDLRKNIDTTQEDLEPGRTVSHSVASSDQDKCHPVDIAEVMDEPPKSRLPLPTRPSSLKIRF